MREKKFRKNWEKCAIKIASSNLEFLKTILHKGCRTSNSWMRSPSHIPYNCTPPDWYLIPYFFPVSRSSGNRKVCCETKKEERKIAKIACAGKISLVRLFVNFLQLRVSCPSPTPRSPADRRALRFYFLPVFTKLRAHCFITHYGGALKKFVSHTVQHNAERGPGEKTRLNLRGAGWRRSLFF